ncbi:putative polysaccharide biosynthesis protein with aminopeptidase-like domain protein [subsurface metagenome]
MSHNQREALPDEEYEVVIDSSLEPGHLSYGEYFIQGESEEEILISTHICHPSLCNDNLSGISIAANLADILSSKSNRYSYRFLFIPGTIGSIVWLSQNEELVHRIKHGLVITLLGDESGFSYKKSRRGNAEIDRVVEHYFNSNNITLNTIDFYPYGYDERQFCSPGFNLPVGCFTRNPHGEFPEYHTSADNLDFVKPEKLEESLDRLQDIIFILEKNVTYLNTNPKCEPQLGKRGLYDKIGGSNESKSLQLAVLWVLNQSDGQNSLLDIAEKAQLDFRLVYQAALALMDGKLLTEVKSTT